MLEFVDVNARSRTGRYPLSMAKCLTFADIRIFFILNPIYALLELVYVMAWHQPNTHEQYGRRFAEDIFKLIFLNDMLYIALSTHLGLTS